MMISLQSLNTVSSKNDSMSNGDADSKGGLESESVKPVNGTYVTTFSSSSSSCLSSSQLVPK